MRLACPYNMHPCSKPATCHKPFCKHWHAQDVELLTRYGPPDADEHKRSGKDIADCFVSVARERIRQGWSEQRVLCDLRHSVSALSSKPYTDEQVVEIVKRFADKRRS